MINLINSATIAYYPNDPEYAIIKEEAQNYFNWSCTAEKAADNIQSRMSIYMSENGKEIPVLFIHIFNA